MMTEPVAGSASKSTGFSSEVKVVGDLDWSLEEWKNHYVSERKGTRVAFWKQVAIFVWRAKLIFHIWPHVNILPTVS